MCLQTRHVHAFSENLPEPVDCRPEDPPFSQNSRLDPALFLTWKEPSTEVCPGEKRVGWIALFSGGWECDETKSAAGWKPVDLKECGWILFSAEHWSEIPSLLPALSETRSVKHLCVPVMNSPSRHSGFNLQSVAWIKTQSEKWPRNRASPDQSSQPCIHLLPLLPAVPYSQCGGQVGGQKR